MFSIDITNLTKQRVPLKTLAQVAVFTAKRLHLQGELSLVLAADTRLKSLNRDFRGLDKVTDVLSFNSPVGAQGLLGEIFINLNDCRRPGKYQEVFKSAPSFVYLLLFLLIHGLLHLAGDDDYTEPERLQMVAKGDKIMKELVKNGIIKASL